MARRMGKGDAMELEYAFVLEYLRDHFKVLYASEDSGRLYGSPAPHGAQDDVKPYRMYIVREGCVDACATEKETLIIMCSSAADLREVNLGRARHPKAKSQALLS